MSKSVMSQKEGDSLVRISAAKYKVTDFVLQNMKNLTLMELVEVLSDCQRTIIHEALKDEWRE